MPTIFVMGTIAQTTETLGPLSVGPYIVNFDNVAQVGEFLKNAGEEFTRKEVVFMQRLFKEIRINYDDLGFIKRLTERSV
jgi:hypothetical protein